MDAKPGTRSRCSRDLSRKEREQVARWADEIDAPRGHHLFDQGRLPHEFFVLETGTVEVTKDGEHLADLGPGDFFGEIAHPGARATHGDGRRRRTPVHRHRHARPRLRSDGRRDAARRRPDPRRDPRTHASRARSPPDASGDRGRTRGGARRTRSASTPSSSATRWFRRSSCSRFPSDPANPAFGSARAEHHPVQPREHDRAGAHRARLQGDVQGAAVQPPRSDELAASRKRQDLRVRGRILHALARVPGRAKTSPSRAITRARPERRRSPGSARPPPTRAASSARRIGLVVCHGLVRADLAEPLVADPEMVRDLVRHRVRR